MRFDDLQTLLSERLERPLPGPDGQSRMAPRPRFGWRPGHAPSDGRQSGVLLLLYPEGSAPHLVLTVRDRTLQHHAGQVSLPGGALEPGESIEDAALRETREEIGADPSGVRLLGALSPLHVPVSGNVLHPRIGVAATRPQMRPDLREVERILEVPLERLSAVEVEQRSFSGRSVDVPYFAVDGEKVWGATAMVLSEFLCVLGCAPDPWSQGIP